MGKGDKRTRAGKIKTASYGNSRSHDARKKRPLPPKPKFEAPAPKKEVITREAAKTDDAVPATPADSEATQEAS